MSTIAILGAGVMGSAICWPARDRGHEVRLIGTHLDRGIIESVRATGLHPKFTVALPEGVESFHHENLGEALRGVDILILGVSSAGVGWAVDHLCSALRTATPVVMLTKGMYAGQNTLSPLPDHVAREVERRTGMKLQTAGIGGPCIAAELAARRHTGTVIAANDLKLAQDLCTLLETSYYHPRPTADMMGVEICAAFKNFFAIAVGWARDDHNAAAMIFNQAIIEMMAITRALGGNEASVWGMAGVGDLHVTSLAGRNSRLGNYLGQGLSYREAISGPMRGETIEGADLGIAAASTLQEMITQGKLGKSAVPLMLALIAALTGDQKFNPPWTDFHR